MFRISTPQGYGTGFLISNAKTTTLCAIATAAHVIDHCHYWEEPIRIEHATQQQTLLLRASERAIHLDSNRDTAAIIFDRADLSLPSEMLPMSPERKFLRVGNQIGWLGFPAISAANLCFFGGRVSAWIQEQETYLVDGVAINGVSGGPAFHLQDDKVILMGVVSAYVPNRATGEALPGLGVVRRITQFQELAPTFASLEQAKSKESAPGPLPPNPDAAAGNETKNKRAS